MHYLIDGYNLLFKIYDGISFQKEREDFISAIRERLIQKNITATIVFDALHTTCSCSRSHIKDIEIVFTDLNQTADEYILEVLQHSKNKEKITVVTSDKQLLRLSRQKKAHTTTTDNFLKLINKNTPLNKDKKELNDKNIFSENKRKNKQYKHSLSLEKQFLSPLKKHETFSNFNQYLETFEKRYQDMLNKENKNIKS